MGKSKKQKHHKVIVYLRFSENKYASHRYLTHYLTLRLSPCLMVESTDLTRYATSEIGIHLEDLHFHAQADLLNQEFYGFDLEYEGTSRIHELESKLRTGRKIGKRMEKYYQTIGANAEKPTALQHCLAFFHGINADLVRWHNPNDVSANIDGMVTCPVAPNSHWKIKNLLAQKLVDTYGKKEGADDAQH